MSKDTVQANVPQLNDRRLRNWFHWQKRSHSQQKDIYHVMNKVAHRFLVSKLWWPPQHTCMFPDTPYKTEHLRWNVPCSQTMVCTEISQFLCNPLLVTMCLSVIPNTTKIIFIFFKSKTWNTYDSVSSASQTGNTTAKGRYFCIIFKPILPRYFCTIFKPILPRWTLVIIE